MPNNNFNVKKEDLRIMLICATRYAMTRQSYILSEIMYWLKTYGEVLNDTDIQILIGDVEFEIKKDTVHDCFDTETLKAILETLQDIQLKRDYK